MDARSLDLARLARRMELAVELWFVRQHPLNVYLEGHPFHHPPYPRPHTFQEVWDARAAANEALAGLPLDPRVNRYAPIPVETEALWILGPMRYPVRVVDNRHGASGGFLERLDDPEPAEPSRKKPWYRVTDWASVHPIA